MPLLTRHLTDEIEVEHFPRAGRRELSPHVCGKLTGASDHYVVTAPCLFIEDESRREIAGMPTLLLVTLVFVYIKQPDVHKSLLWFSGSSSLSDTGIVMPRVRTLIDSSFVLGVTRGEGGIVRLAEVLPLKNVLVYEELGSMQHDEQHYGQKA